jgi:hypothetical protein
MKEPTYSVFVRFRRGQRLTLKRFAPLDVALRFATQVRSERFHDPDDVFIIDDASGEKVVEAASVAGVVETSPEAPPTSAVQKSCPEEESDLDVLLKYVDRWQLRHAQLSLRGGQRLTTTVERSLGQLARLMEHLTRSKLVDTDLTPLIDQISVAVEHVRKVRDGLHELGAKLPELPAREEAGAPVDKIGSDPKPAQQERKKPSRGKG